MPDTSLIPPDMQLAESTPKPNRRKALWYGALFAAVQISSLVFLFWLGGTQWFLLHNAYPKSREAGYSIRATGMNCDIVLYGDSSALTGLDPAIIQAKTGLKTCNLSEPIYVHTGVGSEFPLDYYLARNARPKYLVTMMSATAFNPDVTPLTKFSPEGIAFALNYDQGSWLWKGLLQRPQWLIWFIEYVGQQLDKEAAWELAGTNAKHWKVDERKRRDADAGLWLYPYPPQTKCGRVLETPGFSHEESQVGVGNFRNRYAVGGTKVLIDVTPSADCDPSDALYSQVTAGLTDNQLEFRPIREFCEGDVHPSVEGTIRISNEVAGQILTLVRQDAEGQQTKNSSEKPSP